MLAKEELRQSPLFQNIEYDEYLAMMHCFQARQRSFQAEEVVCDLSSPLRQEIGIVEQGRVSIVRIERGGVSTVLEELGPGSVFGRNMAYNMAGEDSVEVVCHQPCEVIFIDYDQITKRCSKACTHHSVLVENLLQLMLEKAQQLSARVDVLSRRTIRDKLLCCFRHMAGPDGAFRLPFTLSILADYIATDRSAMMRELKKLRHEGIVVNQGRNYVLHEQ